MQDNTDLLIIILSTGFIILILFVCVALGAMIKIMLDIKKITELAKKEAEAISQVVDTMGAKARSFVTNSFVIDKVIPAIMGMVAAGMTAKAYENKKSRNQKNNKSKGKKSKRSDIFSDDEID